MHTLHVALLGSLVASCAYAAILFLRFWNRSRDRFHLFMAAAMLLLAANWVAVTSIRPSGEPHSEIYLVRLAAFLVIIVGIIDKNRRV
jgi:hypothetical protein